MSARQPSRCSLIAETTEDDIAARTQRSRASPLGGYRRSPDRRRSNCFRRGFGFERPVEDARYRPRLGAELGPEAASGRRNSWQSLSRYLYSSCANRRFRFILRGLGDRRAFNGAGWGIGALDLGDLRALFIMPGFPAGFGARRDLLRREVLADAPAAQDSPHRAIPPERIGEHVIGDGLVSSEIAYAVGGVRCDGQGRRYGKCGAAIQQEKQRW